MSFKKVDRPVEDPVFELRYHYEFDDEAVGRGIDPQTDWEVQFARDLIVAAPGSRRAAVLGAATSVIADRQARQDEALAGAFEAVGIDWRGGGESRGSKPESDVGLGRAMSSYAGTYENITMTVHNEGDAPVFQVSGVTESDNPWLDQREFYFGHIPAGESRTFAQRLALHDGYPT